MKKYNFLIQPMWANVTGDPGTNMGSTIANSEIKPPIVEGPVTLIPVSGEAPPTTLVDTPFAPATETTATTTPAKSGGCGCTGKTCYKKKLASLAVGVLVGSLVTYLIVK